MAAPKCQHRFFSPSDVFNVFSFGVVCGLGRVTAPRGNHPNPYAWESAAARALAPRLVGRNRTIDPSVRAAFAQALRDRPGESIEDLLDRTGGASANWSSQSADERFRFAIRRLFTVVGWNLEWSPLTLFLNRQFQRAASAHTFVSFNYDLVLERGIETAVNGALDLRRMYGFSIPWQVTGDPPLSMVQLGRGAFSGMPVTTLASRAVACPVAVLKPHGSLNWLSPIKGHYDESRTDDLHQGRTVILPLEDTGTIRYMPTTNLPPWFQLPGDVPINVEPVIVTPRGAKKVDRPFLREVMDLEAAAIFDAEEVYILGWSVPRTDNDQESLIRAIVSKRPKPFRNVTVVNFLANTDYYERVRQIFGVERGSLQTYNAGFRSFVANS
jgi:hypothetical protein